MSWLEVMGKSKLVGALLLVVVLATGLGACENLSQGPISVKRSGSHMLIAVCSAVHVVAVRATSDKTSTHGDSFAFLRGKGSHFFQEGEIVSTGMPWVSLPMSIQRDPNMLGGHSAHIILSAQNADDGLSAAFDFSDSGLSTSKWQHTDGSLTDAPCTGS